MKKYQLENALTTIKAVENLMNLFHYDDDTQKTIKTLIEHLLNEHRVKLDIEERSHMEVSQTNKQIEVLTKILELL